MKRKLMRWVLILPEDSWQMSTGRVFHSHRSLHIGFRTEGTKRTLAASRALLNDRLISIALTSEKQKRLKFKDLYPLKCGTNKTYGLKWTLQAVTDSRDSPDCLPILLSISVFIFSSSFFHFLVVGPYRKFIYYPQLNWPNFL